MMRMLSQSLPYFFNRFRFKKDPSLVFQKITRLLLELNFFQREAILKL